MNAAERRARLERQIAKIARKRDELERRDRRLWVELMELKEKEAA